jgi:hypothetical protein
MARGVTVNVLDGSITYGCEDKGRKTNGVLGLETFVSLPPDQLLLDSATNIGPVISRWELEKFKNC